jgi:hypothetical protein
LAAGSHYQHDGEPDFLIGVVNPSKYRTTLTKLVKTPMRGATPRPARLSEELETIVRALRDAELLAVGAIPTTCIVNRHNVY